MENFTGVIELAKAKKEKRIFLTLIPRIRE